MLSKFSVKRPYTVAVGVILVILLGVISFLNLQTDLLPEIDLPFVLVMTSYPGASPEEVEMLVTRPIEQVVATTNNIKNVSSTSSENSSVVILEFNNDVNMDSAIIEINGSLDLIKGVWNDSVGTPMIMRLNPDMLPVMIASVDIEDMDISEVSKVVGDTIIPELESINGVASVSGVGLLEESIEVIISKEKIDSLNKKMLASIDEKLSEAEDKLIDAKKEIEDGKAKLESEEKAQMSKLAEGEKGISMAKDQITMAESAIIAGKAELNKNKTDLEIGIKEINKQEEELKSLQTLLLAKGEELTDEEKINLEVLNKGLSEISAKKEEMSSGLTLINEKLNEVEKEELTLNAKKEEIVVQSEQIAQGKAILTTQMNKARAQLNSGEKTINQSIIELEDSKKKAYEETDLGAAISTKMISGILAAQNFSMPAGYVSEKDVDYLVKVGNKIADVEELKGLLLFDTGVEAVGKVYLDDVTEIKLKNNSDKIYAKVNGNNAVMLTFQKQSDFSTSNVSKSIWEKINKIKDENSDINITALMDQGEYIDIVVDSVLNNILYGGLLAILILIIFLRDIKPTIIIALSVPISIVFAIALMYFTGISINIISLAGLALGVGMLVDNSIVVIENIYRLRNEGRSSVEASIEGAKEVAGAILASTLTTASVFLPIVFTKGLSRQLFTDMGLTIAYSLFASLIVALTLVPAMASGMLKRTSVKDSKLFDKFLDRYNKILEWSLVHKAIVMIFVVILLGLSGYFAVSMGTSFIPDMKAPQMSLTIEMPKGSNFVEKTDMADLVIERISGIEGIETIGAFNNESVGGMFGGGSGNSSTSMYLLLDESKKLDNKRIEKDIVKLTEDLDVNIVINSSNMNMTAIGGSGVEILVKGRELDKLQEIAIDISKVVEDTKGVVDVSAGMEENLSEMRIVVNKQKAMENGLTVAQVYSAINSLLSKGNTATTLSVENKDYPVIIIDEENMSIERSDLENLKITVNNQGEEEEILVGDIAKITEQEGLSSIRRKSQSRYLAVTAGIESDYNIGLVSREIEDKLKDYELPDGYNIEFSGENEMIRNSLEDLVKMVLLAIVFIYLIMVAQFQSLLSPFIIMFTIPLAFTGGLLALIITGNELSLIAMLGFLVLSGVVVNNGIVFVDYTNQLIREGHKVNEALVLAGRTRMRPILMTALTTILGLSTLSLGVGVGSEMLQPLAIVSIGGLVYATILTLVVVPVMYSSLHKDKLINADIVGDN